MPVAELEREQTTGSEMTPAMARVAQVRKETYDTFTLALEPSGGEPFPGFTPGQFSMLYVYGNGELPISISGDPEDRARLLYTVRSVGKTTQALVSSRPGDAVGMRGPYGSHWPLKVARGMPPGDLYLSLERNMKCGIGFCGHCQYGPNFICKDGPIFPYHEVRSWFGRYEL